MSWITSCFRKHFPLFNTGEKICWHPNERSEFLDSSCRLILLSQPAAPESWQQQQHGGRRLSDEPMMHHILTQYHMDEPQWLLFLFYMFFMNTYIIHILPEYWKTIPFYWLNPAYTLFICADFRKKYKRRRDMKITPT